MSRQAKSKEAILQQMYNRVASLWGVESVEDLDPLVKLMMQGLSSMLYDVHNEIEDIHVRMLESVASALAPSVMTSPRPAHAVARAYPAEPITWIDRKTVFVDKKIPHELQETGIKSFSFAPVARVRLVAGKIRYLVTGRIFHRVEENGSKTRVSQTYTPNETTNDTLWIGLDLHPEAESLEGLSFYVDFPHSAGKYEKYGNLPYSRWSAGGQPLEIKPGLPHIPGGEDPEETGHAGFLSRYNLLNAMDAGVLDLYRMQYLTVTNSVRLETLQKETFPSEISPLFSGHVTESLEPCYWIRAAFPAHITEEDIHDITVHINTFPVAEKRLHEVTHNTSGSKPDIIPLRTSEREHFVAVEKVSDSHGYEYRPIPYTADGGRNPGSYALKRGGLERFDRRNAGESLERMIDLLRDESAAYSSLNADNMRNLISGMQDNMKQIETKYEQSRMSGLRAISYLLLDRINNDETVFVEYWSTSCELANGIKAGKILTPLSSVFLAKDSCRLLTETRGGKPEAGASGRIDAFRYALTSRDQIFTQEDAANFCRCELGAKIIQVTVSRGIAVSPKPKEGLVRTIDIHLTPARGSEQIVQEMQADLLTMLHRKSPDSFNYRIIIETES